MDKARLVRIVFGAVVAGLAFALPGGLAQGAIVAGSVADPKSDVPVIVAEEHPRDLKSFELSYDGEHGVLTGRITHWDPQHYLPGFSGYHWFDFHADIGVARADGSCDVTSTGSVRTDFATPDDSEGPESIWAKAGIVDHGSEIAGVISGTYDGPWTYTFASPALIRRGYNCVTNVAATHLSSYTVDAAAGFCMGPAGTITCAVTPAEPVIPPPGTDQPIVLPLAGTLGEATRSLTARRARRTARRAVRREFGDRFAKRGDSGFKLACRRTSPSRATCTVKWSYRSWIYRSSVTVTRTAEGVDAVLRAKPRRRV